MSEGTASVVQMITTVTSDELGTAGKAKAEIQVKTLQVRNSNLMELYNITKFIVFKNIEVISL